MAETEGRARSFLGRLGRVYGGAAVAASRLAQAGVSYAWAPVVAAIAAGSVWWFSRDPGKRLKLLGSNKLTFEQQLEAVRGPAAVLGLVALALVVGLVVQRVRRRPGGATAVAARARDLMFPLLAAPFVHGLFQPGIEKDSPKLALLFAAAAAALLGTGVYRLSRPESPPDDEASTASRALATVGKVLAPVAVLAIGAAYGWFFARLSVTNHHAMVTRTIDLGIYDNIFWQSSHGKFLGCTFVKAGYHGSAHFDPILALLSPLYRFIYPRAEFILVLQSVWVASGVVPVYLLARHHLGSRLESVLLSACYALHPALHGANMYEFHSLTLSCVPILWTLYCLASQRRRLYFVAFAVALLVREDIPLMMTMVGITTLLRPEGKMRGVGLATVLLSLSYFVVVKKVFMTSAGVIMSGPEAYSFAYYYDELIPGGKGMGGMLLSLLTNPVFVLTQIFEEAKMVFLVTVFLPLLFLPFTVKTGRLMLAYGLALCLLASRTAVFSTHFQYTNTILPFAFALLPEGIAKLREGGLARFGGLEPRRLSRGLVVATLVASALVSFKFGGIVDNQTFKGGFYRVARSLNAEQQANYAWLEEAVAQIPPKASVGVSNKMGPHVSNRRDVYFYGQRGTDFVLIDEKELKADRQRRHKKALEEGKLAEVTRRGSLVLYKAQKGKPAAKAPPVEEPEDDKVEDVLGDDPRE